MNNTSKRKGGRPSQRKAAPPLAPRIDFELPPERRQAAREVADVLTQEVAPFDAKARHLLAVHADTNIFITPTKRQPHGVGKNGGYVMASNGNIRTLLASRAFNRSATVQAVWQWLIAQMNYGGEVPDGESTPEHLSKQLGLTRQACGRALSVLWSLDAVRPRTTVARTHLWSVNPEFAFKGKAKTFEDCRREFHKLRAAPAVLKKEELAREADRAAAQMRLDRLFQKCDKETTSSKEVA